MKRVFLIVLDSAGCGELPDAALFGDTGANTIGHTAKHVGGLNLPHLKEWGLGNLTPIQGVPSTEKPKAWVGKAAEESMGKDTSTGHWEMAGLLVEKPFPTYSSGFPKPMIDRFISECGLPGILGNVSASGTEIIKELGEEHLKTGKPIVYTSADSVFQIAAHEEAFGLEKLYQCCEVARKLCDEIQVARVIARPFLGSNASDFTRTRNRKDYSIDIPDKTLLEYLNDEGIRVSGIGKIPDIFNHIGIDKDLSKAKSNHEVMQKVLEEAKSTDSQLIFANLVDFDMLYGHRRDPKGYASALESFDQELGRLLPLLQSEDLVILTADHGNDPTHPGTDHTREYVPFIAYRPGLTGGNFPNRTTFSDIAATVYRYLTGKSFHRGEPLSQVL